MWFRTDTVPARLVSSAAIMNLIFYSSLPVQLLFWPVRADGIDLTAGTTPMTIPAPEGYVAVTKEMVALTKTAEVFVPPQNVLLASFIPEPSLTAMQHGDAPNLNRTMCVQAERNSLSRTVTQSDFTEIKLLMRRQQSDLAKKAEREMPGFMETVNQRIKDNHSMDVAIKLGGMVPLPPHQETERSLAFSMLISYSIKNAQGKSTVGAGYATAAFLHVRGKLLFVYVYGDENDLEWTRQCSKDWTAAILAANPSDAATAARESGPSMPRGFDWKRVFICALIGGAIGALVSLFRRLTGKKSGS